MKERIIKKWLIREDLFCIKCGASGDDIEWNDKGSKHPKNEPEGVLFCKKCGHKLTTKEELEELVSFVEILKYSFYLRFAQKWFNPCMKCQEDLDKAFRKNMLRLTPRSIILDRDNDGVWSFVCSFMEIWHKSRDTIYSLIPCEKCQKKLSEILENANWILGNKDYDEPPVELKRMWGINDRKTAELNKNGLIRFNNKDNFGECQKCKKLRYLSHEIVSVSKETKELRWICSGCKNDTTKWKPDKNITMVFRKSGNYKPDGINEAPTSDGFPEPATPE